MSCCPLCSSTNQLTIDATTVCMECATVATAGFTIPVGLMVLAGAVTAAGVALWKATRRAARLLPA